MKRTCAYVRCVFEQASVMETDASSKVETAAEMLNALQMLYLCCLQGIKHLQKETRVNMKRVHSVCSYEYGYMTFTDCLRQFAVPPPMRLFPCKTHSISTRLVIAWDFFLLDDTEIPNRF